MSGTRVQAFQRHEPNSRSQCKKKKKKLLQFEEDPPPRKMTQEYRLDKNRMENKVRLQGEWRCQGARSSFGSFE
jgi:hypothetical protein